MPLVQLVTNLKSLKYGKDTPGGGYSGQPYIQAKIPVGLESKSTDFILRGGYLTVGDSLTDIKRLTKMFFDLKSPNGLFFIAKQNVLSNSAARTQTSGVLNEGIYTPLNTLAQAGVIAFGGHLNKQGINPFEQTGAYAVGDGLYNSVVKSSQPLEENRLAQILKGINENRVTSLEGFKFNEGGVNVLSYKGGPGAPLGVGNTNIRFSSIRTGVASGINFDNYQRIQKTVDINGQQESKVKVEPFRPWTWGGPTLYTPSGSFDLVNSLPSFDLNKPQSGSLSKIPDGPLTWTPKQNNPDSLKYYTNIPNTGVTGKYFRLTNKELKNPYNELGQSQAWNWFSVYEPIIPNNTWPENSDLIYANNTFTYTQEDIIESDVNSPTSDHLSPKIQDFRKVLRASLGQNATKASNLGATPNSLNYSGEENGSIEKRVNIGGKDGLGPGARSGKSYVSYAKGVQLTDGAGNPTTPAGAQDLINALTVYSSDDGPRTDSGVTDLVTFRIGAINNTNPRIVDYIHFRAFIDSFSDNYSSDWSGINYLGRGEKFYTYGRFDRKVSLSFKVAALSKQELIPMYKKLNFLASNLAPDYSGDYGYMKGCFITLTIGGYLYEQPGFITNLSYDMITEMPWEIGINDTDGAQDPTVKQLSHMVQVNSFDFTPIHNFIPAKQAVGLGENGETLIGDEQYIALANPNNGSTNWSILGSVNLS